MNIALIFAGGVGKRMNSASTPKQFLELHGKPIIIYTLEVFQRHPDIDAVCISCVESHMDYMRLLINKFSISKVKWIVPGGDTGQLSIYSGLDAISKDCGGSTVILIHDGVRPLITEELISLNISSVLKHGNAVSVASATETHIQAVDNVIVSVSERATSGVAKAPQSFRLNNILSSHRKAMEEQKFDFIDSATMMRHYGAMLYTVESSPDNIKITTPSDFYIFRAILESKENSQIFGI